MFWQGSAVALPPHTQLRATYGYPWLPRATQGYLGLLRATWTLAVAITTGQTLMTTSQLPKSPNPNDNIPTAFKTLISQLHLQNCLPTPNRRPSEQLPNLSLSHWQNYSPGTPWPLYICSYSQSTTAWPSSRTRWLISGADTVQASAGSVKESR